MTILRAAVLNLVFFWGLMLYVKSQGREDMVAIKFIGILFLTVWSVEIHYKISNLIKITNGLLEVVQLLHLELSWLRIQTKNTKQESPSTE